jgi:hypothetical protein
MDTIARPFPDENAVSGPGSQKSTRTKLKDTAFALRAFRNM